MFSPGHDERNSRAARAFEHGINITAIRQQKEFQPEVFMHPRFHYPKLCSRVIIDKEPVN